MSMGKHFPFYLSNHHAPEELTNTYDNFKNFHPNNEASKKLLNYDNNLRRNKSYRANLSSDFSVLKDQNG